jgi:hypothetical protein
MILQVRRFGGRLDFTGPGEGEVGDAAGCRDRLDVVIRLERFKALPHSHPAAEHLGVWCERHGAGWAWSLGWSIGRTFPTFSLEVELALTVDERRLESQHIDETGARTQYARENLEHLHDKGIWAHVVTFLIDGTPHVQRYMRSS